MSDNRTITRTSEDSPCSTTLPDIFTPSKEMRQVKAKFYSKIAGTNIDYSKLTIEEVSKHISHKGLSNWWTNSEFVSWFKNSVEYSQRINYLLARQLDNLEQIIEDDAEIYSVKDKISAGKQLMEFRQELIVEQEPKDKALSEDDKKQLVEAAAARLLEKRKELKLAPKVDLPT
jgi:hypothetical protein